MANSNRNHRLTEILNVDKAWQMLQCIPSHDRDIWIKIGMAIKSEFGDAGFSLFDEWSKTAHNYDSKAVTSVWKSFKGAGVSIGTLIDLAQQNGWHQSGSYKQVPSPSNISEAPKPFIRNTGIYGLQLWLASNKDDAYIAKHHYAINKGIDWAAGTGRGIASGSVIGNNSDCLIVPIRDIETDRVQGVQCINTESRKQSFGRVSGGALILGNTLDKSLTWYVCEGWASAVSMVFHHLHGNGVCACSFGKSNQDSVALSIADVYQPKEIIVLREMDS